MLIMTTTIRSAEVRIKMFTVRGHNQIMNKSNRDTMYLIRDTLLPFHFMTVAYTRYPGVFEKRTKRWQMMKARIVHHQRPNEFTGALRIATLTSEDIHATATRGTFRAQAPLETKILSGRYAGKMIRRPLTEQRRKELETVNQDEAQSLAYRQQQQYIAAAYDPAYQDRVLKQFR